MDVQRDVISDAFEVFIGHALKGGQGQFFTPRNVVKMMVDILNPSHDSLIIDPACGSGGFLIEILRHVWKTIDQKGKKFNWSENNISKEKQVFAAEKVRGIDKDYFLSKVAKAYMTLIGDGTSGVFCSDSLENPKSWTTLAKQKIKLNTFDILLTNPPFGAKIPVRGESKLKQFELAYKWNKEWERGRLKDQEAPQILFIERCLQLLKDGGKLAIVLPEGIYGNPTDRYIWNYLLDKVKIEAIISTPEETFQPNTHFKTSVLILKKETPEEDYEFFMGLANTCGHNKNGKDIYKIDEAGKSVIDDEILLISDQYKRYKNNQLRNQTHLGFGIKLSEIKNYIFIPDYYSPDLKNEIDSYDSAFELVSISKLIDQKTISVKRGNEVNSKNYGKGDIPFIRTTDIVNWELRYKPTKTISDQVYLKYKDKQDIKAGDILFVKDGTFLIGRTAYITDKNTRIVIQSHINKISVLDTSLFDSYYLLYLLNLTFVQKQIERYTFIQGTISTIGERFNELLLPIHRNDNERKIISKKIKEIIDNKQKIRNSIEELIAT